MLGIGLGTANQHVSAVLEALDVSNRAEAAAVLAGLRLGERDAASPDRDAANSGTEGAVGSKVPGFGNRPLLALLPFEDSDEEGWFTRGLLSDLTRRTARLRWFPVIHEESALATVGADTQPLKARYHAQGSIVRDGPRVFLSLRVVEAESGELVWADRFDTSRDGLDETQEQIVTRIAQELEPAILSLERIRSQRSRAEEVAVWEFCKRAEYRLEIESLEAHRESLALFSRALDLAPESPRAWAGLARVHSAMIYLGFSEDLPATSQRAREAGERALALAPEDPEVQLSIGRAFALSRSDAESVPHLEAALELDPSSSLAANTLAGALRRLGRIEDAIPWYERTLRLSPLSAGVYHVCGGLALSHLSAGRDEEALEWARKAVEGEPVRNASKALDFWPVIPASLALLGRVDEARALWKSGGPRTSRRRMRHSARFTGERLERLAEGLRLAGWEGDLR